jgi:hypothetical protein
VCSLINEDLAGTCKTAGSKGPICSSKDSYESGSYITNAYNLGTFNDSASSQVLSPDVHFKSSSDQDYFKYSIADKTNTDNPQVDVAWTASESVEVCAWYRCNSGKSGQDCAPVVCPTGSVANSNSYVSNVKPNGCCVKGKLGRVNWEPDILGSINETGWAYVRFKNLSPVCQWVNTEISFEGSTKACGDGVDSSGETASTCVQDQGTCVGRCGDATGTCKCDSSCEYYGDCCWDHNLYCLDT